ncbi:MAG TPA: HNH endonuclease signature motif containing protein [Nitrosopumilaceae archaeon]|nr:HNH endonuclease signature motif containing protein [Nitrosopumilaceae archaeon]
MDFEGFIARQASHILKELLQEGLISKKPRRGFSKYVKKRVLSIQSSRCNYCYIILDLVNYDHIDGNRSNNLFFNCQALCPNCHAKKTRRKV